MALEFVDVLSPVSGIIAPFLDYRDLCTVLAVSNGVRCSSWRASVIPRLQLVLPPSVFDAIKRIQALEAPTHSCYTHFHIADTDVLSVMTRSFPNIQHLTVNTQEFKWPRTRRKNVRAVTLKTTVWQKLAPTLRSLDLTRSGASDIATLAQLVHLEELNLSFCPVTSIDTLHTLSKMRKLDIRQTLVGSIDCVAHMLALEWLDIRTTAVQSLTPLRGLKKLRCLKEQTESDFPSVNCLRESLSKLTIAMSYDTLKPSGAIADNSKWLELLAFTRLRELTLYMSSDLDWFGGLHPWDVSVLANITSLEVLRVTSHQGVIDTNPLGRLKKLRKLRFVSANRPSRQRLSSNFYASFPC